MPAFESLTLVKIRPVTSSRFIPDVRPGIKGEDLLLGMHDSFPLEKTGWGQGVFPSGLSLPHALGGLCLAPRATFSASPGQCVSPLGLEAGPRPALQAAREAHPFLHLCKLKS